MNHHTIESTTTEVLRPPHVNEVTADAIEAWRRRVDEFGPLVESRCATCRSATSPLVCACARRLFIDAYMDEHWLVDDRFVDSIVDSVTAGDARRASPADYVEARRRARRRIDPETRALLTDWQRRQRTAAAAD